MFSIISLIREGNVIGAIMSILARCFVVFCCMPIHEFAHVFVANKLGDSTGKNAGRMTLNPLKHLTPIGTLMIFLFGIGYANPAPVNPNNFKNAKAGMAITALAGPMSNFIMAAISMFAYCFLYTHPVNTLIDAVALFFYYSAFVNVTLSVFNLLPIPPLDGSKILASVLPNKAYYKYMMYERYVMIALMIMLFTGVLDRPISFLSNVMMNVISIVPMLIFG